MKEYFFKSNFVCFFQVLMHYAAYAVKQQNILLTSLISMFWAHYINCYAIAFETKFM